MSAITDIILSQVKESAGGKLDGNVLSGLSDSILGSVKQSAQSVSGIEDLTQLFTGKTDAAKSPVTALAGKLFKADAAKKLGLDSKTAQLAIALLPTIINALVSKKNGLDITSILGAFVGGQQTTKTTTSKGGKTVKTASGKAKNESNGGALLGAAVNILGKLLK